MYNTCVISNRTQYRVDKHWSYFPTFTFCIICVFLLLPCLWAHLTLHSIFSLGSSEYTYSRERFYSFIFFLQPEMLTLFIFCGQVFFFPPVYWLIILLLRILRWKLPVVVNVRWLDVRLKWGFQSWIKSCFHLTGSLCGTSHHPWLHDPFPLINLFCHPALFLCSFDPSLQKTLIHYSCAPY